MKNQRKKTQNQNGMRGKRIDINSIYLQMKASIVERAVLQKEMDILWDRIKRYNCDRSTQMKEITEKIGKCTHKLNQLINELCQYRKTHRAMNLAHDYIVKEITRINKIVNSKKQLIAGVNRGSACLISSNGVTHTNTLSLENYVKQKTAQIASLEKWKRSVERYMV